MVAIKNAVVPPSCYLCPMTNDGFYLCKANNPYRQLEDDCEERRPDWCPLVSVPPHSRLIDADALAKTLGITDMDCYKCAWGNHGFCGRGGDFNDACEAIEDAPTIIPADPA